MTIRLKKNLLELIHLLYREQDRRIHNAQWLTSYDLFSSYKSRAHTHTHTHTHTLSPAFPSSLTA